MFHFLCKSIHYHGRLNITASRARDKFYVLQNCKSMLFSCKCLSNNAYQHSFTVSYLINSCGLSLDSALSASKYVHFETPEKPDSVLGFLKSHGFSEPQITKITKTLPKVLLSSPVKTLLPKFEFFHSKGISYPDIAKILSNCPPLFHRGIEKPISNFNSLSNLLQSSEKTIALIKRFPLILYHNVEYFLLPNVNILRDSGVPESNIVKFINIWPQLILTNSKRFEKKVAAVKETGINPLRSQFFVAIAAYLMSESLWESKLDIYKKWGWSEKEWLAAFAKCPWCMLMSVDKITEALDFFVNEMGWKSSVIAKHPILIQLSMEKRIIPRAAVLQFLLSKGLIKESTNFVTLLRYSEQIFLQRFVNRYDEAPDLLRLYQEKLDLSNKTKCSS